MKLRYMFAKCSSLDQQQSMFLCSTVIVRKMKRKGRVTIDEGGRTEAASDGELLEILAECQTGKM